MFSPYPLTTYHLLGAALYLSFIKEAVSRGFPSPPRVLFLWFEDEKSSKRREKFEGERLVLVNIPQSRDSVREPEWCSTWHWYPNKRWGLESSKRMRVHTVATITWTYADIRELTQKRCRCCTFCMRVHAHKQAHQSHARLSCTCTVML